MPRRILLVEDDHETHQTILRALGACGDAVDRAPDAASAVALASLYRYDAILLDYHHPAMAGHGLARTLRRMAHGLGRDTRLVGLTAHGSLALRRGADGLFDAFLARPLCDEALRAVVAHPGDVEAQPMNASSDQVQAASLAIWQARGLTGLPAALALPPPDAGTAAALSLCFHLVATEEAACVLLLERHGLRMIPEPAPDGARRPVIALLPDLADIADAVFDVDDEASWTRVARCLGGSAAAATPAPAGVSPVRPLPVGPAAAGLVEGLRTILSEDILSPLSQARRSSAGAWPAEAVAVLARVEAAAAGLAAVLAEPRGAAPEGEVVDLAAVIGDVAAMAGPAVAVSLDGRVAARLRLDGDPLRHLLVTLLDHLGGGRVRIAATVEPQDTLVLALSAEGGPPAAPGADLPPLRRLAGLRLSAARRLVGLMGGSLEIAADGDGRALLRLPYRPADAAAPRPAEASFILLHADPLAEAILGSFVAGAGCRAEGVDLTGAPAPALPPPGSADAVLVDVPADAAARHALFVRLAGVLPRLGPLPVVALVDADAWLSDAEAALCHAVRPKPRHTRDIRAIVEALDLWTPRPREGDLVDAEVLAGIVQSLGSDTVEALLVRLRSVVELQLVPLHRDGAADPADRQRVATSVGSAAGMLGLTALRALCSAGDVDLTRVGALAEESIRAALRLARAA